MKGLLIKDLYLLKDNKAMVGIFFAMAILLVTVNTDASFIVAFMTMIMSMLCITTISYDEFDHSNSFLMTLPISRKLYIKEKYCLGFLLGISGWALSSLLATVLQSIKIESFNYGYWFMSLSVFLLLAVICNAIMIPVQLKFGGDKGRLALFGVILFVFLLGAGFVGLCQLLNIDLEQVLVKIMQIPVSYIVIATIICALLCLYVSYRISVRIMLRKQF